MASKKQTPEQHVPIVNTDGSVAVDLAEQELARLTNAPPAPAPALTITQQRAILAAAGLKTCNRHLKYFDRLPDAAKVAVEGYPVEVRPRAEFATGAACCRPCYRLYDQEWREAHRTPGTPTSRARQEAMMARKVAQRDALNAEIARLQAALAALPGADAGAEV
jgi:hypothetical protein